MTPPAPAPERSRTRLDNGLEILVETVAHAPVTAVYLWIEAGAADESASNAGTAHFLEHMLFKGTAARHMGVAAREIESLGGDLNAYTSHDQTVLHATVGAEHWRQALAVIADMATRSVIDPDEVERERKVILEEIRGYDDEPEAVVSDDLAAGMYPEHPYGRPVLGNVETVGGLTRQSLHDFWRQGWCAGRALLAIAGPVDAADAVAAAQEALGSWATGEPRAPLPQATAAPARTHVLRRDFDTSSVEITWPAPPVGHPDLPALDVLAAVLGQGAAAELVLRLQLDEGLAGSVWADLGVRVSGSTFAVGFLPMEDEAEAAVRTALQTIGRVARSGLPSTVVTRARDALVSEFLFSRETVDGIAHDLAWYTARLGGPEARETTIRQIQKVSPADVQRVARTWLRADQCHVVALDPNLEPEALARAVADGQRAFARPRRASGSLLPSTHTLRGGAQLLLLPDASPVVGVRILALGGGLAVPPRRAGLPAAWSGMISAGAGPWDAGGFARACDEAATVADGVAGRSTIGLQASMPSHHADDGLEIVGRMLLEPRFEPDEWDRVGDELIEEVRTLGDRPGQLAMNQLWASLYPGHPWRLPATGTEASLERISTAAIADWHSHQLHADGLIIAMAGGIDPDTCREVAEGWAEDLETSGYRPTDVVPGKVRHPRQPLVARTQQAVILLGFRAAPIGHPDHAALELAAAILGAQSGRLFMELRESRGIGYSVWATQLTGLHGGAFLVGLSTEPARVDEARAQLRAELARLAHEVPPAEEVARTRRMLVGQRAMGMQRATSRAADAAYSAILGTPRGLEGYRSSLDAVTPAAISAALTARGALDPVEILVLPDR